MKKDSGIYNLKISVGSLKKISVGKLGSVTFLPGYYIYTGRAKRGLQKRLDRHRRREKKFHWHIDYLLKWGRIDKIRVYPWSPEGECSLNGKIMKKRGARIIAPGFGSSDCRCSSHLVYFQKDPLL
jgi:Uri superfamily endonuclease